MRKRVLNFLSLVLTVSCLGESEAVNYWAIEDATERAALPEYKVIPAATIDELTPSRGKPFRDDYRNWPRSHGDENSSRYSGLAQINRTNVHQLEVAWIYRSGDGVGNVQCNPVIVDEVMFAFSSGNHVVAVDAGSGEEIWRFDPDGQPTRRGLLHWRDPNGRSDRLIFTAGLKLHVIMAETGKPDMRFGTGGTIDLPDTSRVPVILFEDTLVVATYKKHVYGFDYQTGEQKWIFRTVPEAGEFGYDTWDQPAAVGANAWGGITFDRERGIAYFLTGSPKPNFLGERHRGQNLFANCLVALDVRTGTRLWHFQEVRHDIWDIDGSAPPILTTIIRGRQKYDVVVAVTKLGNTLLLDRLSGKPIFPFRLRRALTSQLPGMMTWPYQPDPELPEPISRQQFTMDDVTDLTPESRRYVTEMLIRDQATTGWMVPNVLNRPNVVNNLHGGANWPGGCVDPDSGTLFVNSNDFPWYIAIKQAPEHFVDETLLPTTPGRRVYESLCMVCHGTSREGSGESPPLLGLKHRSDEAAVTALVTKGKRLMPAMPHVQGRELGDLLKYLFEQDRVTPGPIEAIKRPRYVFDRAARGGPPHHLVDQDGQHGSKPPWGKLNAIDLNTGRIKWQVPFGENPKLMAKNHPITGSENFGGPSVTAGGVVFSSGAADKKIKAYDVDTGEELWQFTLPFAGTAPPSVYEAGGRQYIVIPATGGGKLNTEEGDAYVAFALP